MKKYLPALTATLILFLACSGIIAQISQTSFSSIKFQLTPLQNFYKQRMANAILISEAFKTSLFKAANLTMPENGLSSTITITKYPSYTTNQKVESAVGGNTSACAPFSVNYKKSDIDFSLDASSNSQLKDVVYPGALINATYLLNGNYSDGLSSPLPINPVDLNTSMLPLQLNQTSSRRIDAVSATNIKNALNNLYLQNAQGGTNAPSVQFVEAFMLESGSQFKAEAKQTWDFDASRTVGVPLEAINISAGVSGSGNVSTSGSVSLQKQKSYAVLVYKHFYYSANIVPVQPEGTSGGMKYCNTATSNIPDDLLYIDHVDYGRLVYIVISAEASREELAFALNRKFGSSIDMGLSVAGSDLGIGGSQGASYSDELKIKKIFNEANINFKLIAYGGNPLTIDNFLTSPNTILNATNGPLNYIATRIMNQVQINYSTNNVPLPIGFSCRFAKDGSTAYVNSNINYYSETCSPPIRFDVDLELDNLDFITINSGKFGDHEELYGKLKFTYLKAVSREVNTDRIYWDVAEGAKSYGLGKTQVDKRENIIKNLTYEELRNISLYIGGELHDDEGIFASRNYKCDNCQDISGDYGKRRIYFIELSSTQSSIAALKLNGDYQPLTIGGDNFLELNFYESDKKDEGYVKANWKVWVKPHQ